MFLTSLAANAARSHNTCVFGVSIIGWLALLGRVIGIGFERPLVKALGKERDSIAATVVYFGFGEILLLPLVIREFILNPNVIWDAGTWISAAMLSGLVYTAAFHSYFYGMGKGEVSYLTPLYSSMFVFLYFLDIVFGEARFGLLPMSGIACVALGVIFLNVEPGKKIADILNPLTVLKKPGAVGMLVYSFGLALGRIIDNGAADNAPPIIYAFVNNSLCVILGIVFLMFTKRVKNVIVIVKDRFWIALFGSFAGMYAYVLMLIAIDYFNPSVVEPVTQLSIFIALFLGGLWFNEPTRTRWLPSALVVVGAALLVVH